MKNIFKKLALMTTVLLTANAHAETQKVSLYTYHTHVPFITGDHRGLSYDLAEMLTNASSGKYEFKVVATSRPRINKLINGKSVGFVPWVNPVWFKDKEQTKYLWGQSTLMEDANAILSHQKLSKNYQGPESISGLVFGGITGHVYSDIDDFIKKGGNLRRVNSDNHNENMNKIRSGDVDIMLMPRSSALYTIAQENLTNELFVSPTPHSSYSRSYLVINHNADLLKFIEQTIASQKAAWNSVIAKYQ